MDGFNDNFETNDFEADPAAEFLAREQNNLAGLEDDIPPVVANGIGDKEGFPAGENESDSGFEMVNHSSFDNFASNGIGFDVNNVTEGGGSPTPTPIPQPQITREEPEKIKRWREEQKTRLEQKDDEEENKKAELREAAKKELEDWYKTHEEQVAKNRNANRSAEKELVADTDPIEPGTEWERIAKLCDFNPKGSKHSKDISRMRSIILQVKQNPPIPSKRQ
ncbi:unnamed protein product [Allacma fusca]|uniref:Clathrin light chain n=1 Tax=Allacma fusca TaxID=39272 RepID=A0A8J2KBA8_9HEXA|nr:unnamed protein product [Allacma fusca]